MYASVVPVVGLVCVKEVPYEWVIYANLYPHSGHSWAPDDLARLPRAYYLDTPGLLRFIYALPCSMCSLQLGRF